MSENLLKIYFGFIKILDIEFNIDDMQIIKNKIMRCTVCKDMTHCLNLTES